MNGNQLTIDLDKILDTANKGVRRASAFLGLGTNAANNPEFTDYELTNISTIQLLPSNLNDDSIAHLKEEFGLWVIANGFRELIETFSIFLNQIHHVCTLFEMQGTKITPEELAAKHERFSAEGFPNILNMLEEAYSISPTHAQYIKSLNKARNCLTHRQGVVAVNDCNQNNALTVSWLGMNIYIEEPDGTKHVIEAVMEESIFLENGGEAKFEMIEKKCVFKLGALVRFSPQELAEICWFMQREAQSIVTCTIEYAKSKDIKFKVLGNE